MTDPVDCADTELTEESQYSDEQIPVASTDHTHDIRKRVHIATLHAEMETLEQERDKFARQVSELEDELEQLRAEVSSLERTIEQKDNQLEQVIDNYETILERKDARLEAAEQTTSESDSQMEIRRLFSLLS